jgi:hypothetical protein
VSSIRIQYPHTYTFSLKYAYPEYSPSPVSEKYPCIHASHGLRCRGLLSTAFQQTLRSDRPVFWSIRLASPFLAPLALFYMFSSYYVFGISLAGSTSGCSAVPVCLARLSDVFLVPAMTRATLYALGTGNRDAFAITSQSWVACATTTTRHHHNPHRIPSHSAADRAQTTYSMHSRATSTASRSAFVQVQHAFGRVYMICAFGM